MILSIGNITLSNLMDSVILRIDTSRVWDGENDHVASWAIRNLAEDEIRAEQGQSNWRCLVAITDPKCYSLWEENRGPISCSHELFSDLCS